MTNEAAIDRFFGQVSDAQAKAEELEPTFFGRIVLISLLDALSRCAHPNLKGNRSRFVALIDDYSQWNLASTYSLRQLSLRLNDVTNQSAYPGFHDLEQEIRNRMQSWPAPGAVVFPGDTDPTLSDLGSILTPQLKTLIEPVRYPSLLWRLRNYVIHEVRNPGKAVDFEVDIPSPYYHSFTHADGIKKTWELYFPNELLSHLLTNCTNNLNSKMRRDDIDPWLAFPYDPKWY